jgi:acyl-CoA hydrolase
LQEQIPKFLSIDFLKTQMNDTVDVKRVLDMAGELIATLKRNHMDEWTEVMQALVVVLNRKSVSLSGTIYLHDIFEVKSKINNRLQL